MPPRLARPLAAHRVRHRVRLRGASLAAVAWVAAACAPAAPATTPSPGAAPALDARAGLRRLADSLVTAPEFANAHWGVLIVNPATGDTLYSRNAGKLFMPASNQKLLTGAVALARLGPDYRFRTEVGATVPPRDGVLAGDLVITGYGDPSVSDHALTDAMLPLRAIADSLFARGVRRVTGNLVAGGDALPGPVLGFGWAWDDLEYPYSAGVDELLFNEGFSRVVVHAGARAGDAVRVRTLPARSFPEVQVQARTVAADSGVRRSVAVTHGAAGGTVVVSGAIPAGDSAVLSITHRDPNTAYLAALREALTERGITVEGTLVPRSDGGATRADSAWFTMASPPLRELMPRLQKPSQNQIAELFLRVLGLEVTGEGSADSGRRVVERQMAEWGAVPGGYVVRDGSGLSRHDYVTPETIVRVLAAAQRDTAFQVFYDALPIAGVDGTIASRMKGTPAAGNVRAKTGYIDRARSLSGYVTTADGTPLIFSFLSNNWTTTVRDVERVQDALAARMAAMSLGAPLSARSARPGADGQ